MQNNRIIGKITKKTLTANRGRNIFLILAISLTAFMLCTVFSVGMSYMESQKMQQIRMMGTTAHGAISEITDEQLDMMASLDYIETYGSGIETGMIIPTEETYGMTLLIYWSDNQKWDTLITPAYTDIIGEYPTAEDEIMIPRWVLEKLGITVPEIGMEITFIVIEKNEYANPKTFRLSGWFTNYTYIRTGSLDILYVSEEYAVNSGYSRGAVQFKFKNDDINTNVEMLAEDLGITIEDMNVVPMFRMSDTDTMVLYAAVIIIIILLMLTGGLLIYNVLLISVSKDIRFYGLLKAVGMTQRQIKSTVYNQIMRLCIVGVPAGLLTALIFSYFIVPGFITAMNMGNADTGIVISFNPLIYIGSVIFTVATAVLGAVQPAKKAARISPIEAIRYTEVTVGRKSTNRSVYGNSMKIAWRNVFRVRRQAIVVFASLFLGLTMLLMVTTLIDAMNVDNFVNSYNYSDIELRNEFARYIGGTLEKQMITPDMLDRFAALNGLTAMRTYYLESVLLTYDSEMYGKYVEMMAERFGEEFTDEYLDENFIASVISLTPEDIEGFNRGAETPIDIEAFERGEFAFISIDEPELLNMINDIEITMFPAETVLKIPFGGFIPAYYKVHFGGIAPNIYVSQSFMESLFDDPTIYKVELDVEEKYQKEALDRIDTITNGVHEITRVSRYETREEMKGAKTMMYILGGGISVILGLIGIFNFVNLMFTQILTRKHEITMLESIGQTKKQTRKMLISEGMIYAVISSLLVCIFGNAITYGLFKMFQQQADYAIYRFPLLQLAVMILVVVIVCITIPLAAYNSISKNTIVERLRDN